MMEEEKMDQFLKDKLESLEAKVPKDAWKSFSEKWNDALLNDQTDVDKKFYIVTILFS
jgi:hypothetical protein